MRAVTLSSVDTYVLLLHLIISKVYLAWHHCGLQKRVSLYLSRKKVGAVQCKVSQSMTLWGGGGGV